MAKLKFTAPVTKPDKPPLKTPFDELLLDEDGNAIVDVAQWERKRTDTRKRFLDILGEFPASKPDLDPTWIDEADCGTYVRKTVRYSVHDDEEAEAYVCIPKAGPSPLPSVLCLHGTCDQGRNQTMGLGGDASLAFGKDLAERGFVTLCADHFVAGKRVPAQGSYDTSGFYRRFPRWSAVGKALWEESIAVDLLQSLPEVDSGRIGCIGHSLGGHGTAFFAAHDERITCAVANCGITSFRCNPLRAHWSRDGWYIYIPKLRELFLAGKPSPVDFHEIVSLIAPRPLLDISALNEPSFDGQEHLPGMFLRVHEVYTLHGAEAKFAHYMHGCGHGIYHHSRALAYAWLETWLMNSRA